MVSHTGTKTRPHHVRPLNEPRAVTVAAERGMPVSLTIGRHRHRVDQIQDAWIIEDEWWRQPISRQYFAILLDDGSFRTIYHDRVADTWHAQDY